MTAAGAFGLIDAGRGDRRPFSLGTGHVVQPFVLPTTSASKAATEIFTDLTFPADARVETAVFDLAAEAVPSAELSSVATVRVATADDESTVAAAVDFGRLVTVSGVFAHGVVRSLGITRVDRWDGTAWARVPQGVGFAEIATERLRLHRTSGTPADLVETLTGIGAVGLPVRPASLELLVDGATVWFERQGSSPGAAPPQVAGATVHRVDRTEAVREALARAVPSGGQRAVRVLLRAATPGQLSLVPAVGVLREHTVAFPPDGAARTVELAEEGLVELAVTPPGAADVREVELAVRGSFGPDRVLPPTGPPMLEQVALRLAPGRSLLVGLPATLCSRFGTLTGVRLALRAAPGGRGGEVTGRLLGSLHLHQADPGAPDSRPGDPLPGGELTPLTITDPARAWHTLALAEPLVPPPPPGCEDPDPAHRTAPGHDPGPASAALWMELQLGYGDVECGCTGADPRAELRPGGPVLRRLPGGGVAGLTRIPALGPLRAALRVVGRPDRDRPLPAVTLGVSTPGGPGAEPVELEINPGGNDVQVRLTAAAPLDVTGGAPVHLTVLACAAGSLTVAGVRVAYREEQP